MSTEALTRAIEVAGGQSELARKLGLKQGHIWHWLNKSKRVPAEYVLAIEAATDGQVTRHELRPDIYPSDGGPFRSEPAGDGCASGGTEHETQPIRAVGT